MMLLSVSRKPLQLPSACTDNAGMATSRNKTEMTVALVESEGLTKNRTRQERRVGSGNVRAGQAHRIKNVGAVSSSKTGPDSASNRKGDRTRANKQPSRH
jgi:hypothetical protein